MAILKRLVTWVLVLLGGCGVVVSYYGIYILLAYFASGLVVWAEVALFISGPIGVLAASIALIKPRQRIAMTVGLLTLAA